MPMGTTEDLYGTEANGSLSKDYCKFCYAEGVFVDDCTMEQMMKVCIDLNIAYNEFLDSAEVQKMVEGFFLSLKRWNK
jgi:hypothetical protein